MASDRVTAVTIFTHKIWTGVIGSVMPSRTAISTIAACPTLVGSTKTTALRRLSYTVRPSSTAAAIEAKLSSTRTMSAASLAASVPLWPMATPTSARLSAGASLTPSPVIAATSPLACMASTRRSLCSGLARAKTSTSATARRKVASSMASTSAPVSTLPFESVSPIARAMAAAVTAWSPVIIFTRMPAAWQAATARTASSRGGSMMPARASSVRSSSTSAKVSSRCPCAIGAMASARTR